MAKGFATLRVNGKLSDAIGAMRASLDKPKVMAALTAAAEPMAATAKATAARRTGKAAESVAVRPAEGDRLAVTIGPDKEHFYLTSFVERGTSKLPPRPAFRAAFDAHRGQFLADMRSFFRRVLREAGVKYGRKKGGGAP